MDIVNGNAWLLRGTACNELVREATFPQMDRPILRMIGIQHIGPVKTFFINDLSCVLPEPLALDRMGQEQQEACGQDRERAIHLFTPL